MIAASTDAGRPSRFPQHWFVSSSPYHPCPAYTAGILPIVIINMITTILIITIIATITIIAIIMFVVSVNITNTVLRYNQRGMLVADKYPASSNATHHSLRSILIENSHML